MSELKKRIEHIENEKEWLDGRIDDIFAKYREIYEIRGNGVYDWELQGKTLVISQDVSCRGCHDTERRELPAEYLYSEDYEFLIKRDFEKYQQEEKERKAKELEYKIYRTKQQLEDLQKEMER